MQAGMSPMSMAEIFAALTQRLIALGQDPTDAPERAVTMLIGWHRFTENDIDGETGRRQCDSWMDAEFVKLLDAGLNAYWLGKEPYPTAPR
jgi:hypothetical protein